MNTGALFYCSLASLTRFLSLLFLQIRMLPTCTYQKKQKKQKKAGTGILALPYACKQGGLLLFIFGMFLIPLWNVYCMKLLCDSLEYLVRLADSPSDDIDVELSPETLKKQSISVFGHSKRDMIMSRTLMRERLPPPIGTSSFSKLGWYAMGKGGLWIIDLMMLMLLLFINIAFEVAILTFAESTPFTTGRKIIDAIILGFLLVPLCIVDDMSALSKLSRLGLIILGFTMLVIAFYGISGYENNNLVINSESDGVENNNSSSNPFSLFPHNGIEGISKWFGCVVFSFGVVPLTFNFRESMAEPEKLQKAAMISMSLVGVCYVIIGVSFLYLFPNIEVDLLSKIPSHGMLATTTRLAMIITTMASTPLLIVPCAEIIEGKILNNEDGQTKSKKLMIIIRTCILLCTVLIASELPSFVSVLAFAGSFAVSMVSFVLPPGLHWLLLRQGYYDGPGGLDFPIWSRICDLSMLLIGFLTTIITTWFAGS
jgi:amino acid permease